MDILDKEREAFIEGAKLNKKTLSLKNPDDYYVGMEKAFDDAFNQYARRKKVKYAENKRELMKDVAEKLYEYFTADITPFDVCFNECITASKKILDNGLFGIAQKFVNMSFKYLYCYGDAKDYIHKFADCHLPLDKYTVKWIRSLKNKEINRRLTQKNNAWANIDEALYNGIQNFVSESLAAGIEYTVSYDPRRADGGKCRLPQNRLETEFIVWHQEKINELRGIMKKITDDEMERLGLTWIGS